MSDARAALTDIARRRLSAAADLGFFTSSASNFHPRPYKPASSATPSTSAPIQKQPSARSTTSVPLSHSAPPMDPSSADPEAVFIHPPFTSFPDAHRHSGGLTYNLMALHPEWFLDPDDFVSQANSNPNAITYPSQLEPPRGWCPSKKKDLKDRGTDSWPEGEEPRLRCTFCRRTYAGVNAKSMWRRHVFEKHKIAMANRRDTVDRGRKVAPKELKTAQGKENQTSSRSSRKDTASVGVSATMTKPKLRSLRPTTTAASVKSKLWERAGSHDSLDDNDDDDNNEYNYYEDEDTVPHAPRIPQQEFPVIKHPGPPLSQASSRTSPTPPPDSPEPDVDAPEIQEPVHDDPFIDDSDEPPTPKRPMIPSSPYDPRATPSFRHSPPRLPSDQPWRFPSPSHPLHSMADISLGQVALNSSSPAANLASNGIEVSPVYIGGRSSAYSTPGVFAANHSNSAKPTPRRLFLTGGAPVPLTERLKKAYKPAEESPLRHSSIFTPRMSKIADPALLDPSLDPFVYDGTPDTFNRGSRVPGSPSPPTTNSETDSPIIRKSRLSDSVLASGSRRSGLQEAFSLRSLKRGMQDDPDDSGDDDDDGEGEYRFSGRLHLASPVSRLRLTQSKSYSEIALKTSPGAPRGFKSGDQPPVRKRRKTIAE